MEREREENSTMEKAINRQKVMLDHRWPTSSHSSQTHVSFLSASICLAGDTVTYHITTFGDDVVTMVVCCSTICKEKHGAFKDILPGDLFGPVLKVLIEKTNLNQVKALGMFLCRLGSECKMTTFYAGFFDTLPVQNLSRNSSSGLQAVVDVVASIKAGYCDFHIV